MVDLPADWGARVRAARGYSSATSQEKFGEMLGVSIGTIKSYEKGGTPDRRAIPETIQLLVKASGLPEWFFTVPTLDEMGVDGDNTADTHLAHIQEELAELKAESALRDAESQARDEEVLSRIDSVAQAIDQLQPPPRQ